MLYKLFREELGPAFFSPLFFIPYYYLRPSFLSTSWSQLRSGSHSRLFPLPSITVLQITKSSRRSYKNDGHGGLPETQSRGNAGETEAAAADAPGCRCVRTPPGYRSSTAPAFTLLLMYWSCRQRHLSNTVFLGYTRSISFQFCR